MSGRQWFPACDAGPDCTLSILCLRSQSLMTAQSLDAPDYLGGGGAISKIHTKSPNCAWQGHGF